MHPTLNSEQGWPLTTVPTCVAAEAWHVGLALPSSRDLVGIDQATRVLRTATISIDTITILANDDSTAYPWLPYAVPSCSLIA